jgi:predicted O-methyltransferase YrrM
MEHIYKDIQGWFDFPDFYTKMVQKFESGSKFVEVGTWMGQSVAYLAVEIINSNKNIELFCVDTWLGSEEHHTFNQHKELVDGTLYETFLKNIEPIKNHIKPIRSTSVEAAKLFEDKSLDFIFIDAAHDYENVKADLKAWFPKLKSNGVIAGHDYHGGWPGNVQAVQEFCSENNLTHLLQCTSSCCWCVSFSGNV